MDALLEFLSSSGYIGMFIAAFLAGSVFPLNSEIILSALVAAGLNSWLLVIYATIGNVLGGMFNYGIGRLGRMDWIERYLGVDKKKIDRAQRFMSGHGAWMGFFAFIPFIGEAITVVLGLTRASIPISLLSMTIGKGLRYVALAGGLSMIF